MVKTMESHSFNGGGVLRYSVAARRKLPDELIASASGKNAEPFPLDDILAILTTRDIITLLSLWQRFRGLSLVHVALGLIGIVLIAALDISLPRLLVSSKPPHIPLPVVVDVRLHGVFFSLDRNRSHL